MTISLQYDYDDNMNQFETLSSHLVGVLIKEASINDNKNTIRLNTDEGILFLQTQSHCCNSVWFESVVNPEFLIGTVLSLSLGDSTRERDNEDCDVLDIAFLRINTTSGTAVIEVRNSHNGYYGGEVIITSKPNTYWNYQQTDSWTDTFKPIQGD